MNYSIPTKKKQTFLNWFLNHYRLKKRESFWILNYLLNHPHTLKNVHFVHDITHCPRSMVITSVCSNEIAFLFCKNHIVTTDADKAFHDLRFNKNEPLYIQLQFNKANQNVLLAGVLEENPFLTDEEIVTKEDKENAQQILHNALYAFKKQTLLKNIDHALDNKNEQLFNELVNQLHTLDSSNGKPPVIQQ
ncbi:MAG TPA: ReoY family proteolytic degradation factor [Bacillota bacterium]|nr:ReoY family proteolytic degradation factor [Bacillota bacterium]